MSVDFDTLAARCRCDASHLRLAAPLIEQGLTPPFLARYRRDELGGVDETSLWALHAEMQTDRETQQHKETLRQRWESTELKDPSLRTSIDKSHTPRMLQRIERRLRREPATPDDATRLAVRVLNPTKGDGGDPSAIAAKVDGIDAAAALAGLDDALASRLAMDPRIVGVGIRWLSSNAKIKVNRISDPHTPAKPAKGGEDKPAAKEDAPEATAEAATTEDASAETTPDAADTTPDAAEASTETAVTPNADAPVAADASTADEPESHSSPSSQTSPSPADEPGEPTTPEAAVTADGNQPPTDADPPQTEDAAPSPIRVGGAAKPSSPKAPPPKAEPPKPKPKKISPRQRRRRWLVGVLKHLSGKRLDASRMSSFQIVMLARALRSEVADCSFEYDAAKLVAELRRAAGNLNRGLSDHLSDLTLKHEAAIREMVEAAWWDDLQQKASDRLVDVTADQLRDAMSRGGITTGVTLAVDAVGPKTAPVTVVAADGRVLHNEDLPCGLGRGPRTAAATRLGELIHAHGVDLIVVSNGPARRGVLMALSDLIGQSPEGSIRWTLAERSGADAYAGSPSGDSEMKQTPRRFRAAAWLAFSVSQPAQALSKVDPTRLRLNAFQKELSDDALEQSLGSVAQSGASRGGVDVNGSPLGWLAQLPGLDEPTARSIDAARRETLFTSRGALEGGGFLDTPAKRQSLPFLRVFGSDEVLDGTLIHPDDYPLATKLAAALSIEMPPASPPGYEPPDYSAPQPAAPSETKLTDATPAPAPAAVEDFSSKPEDAPEFAVDAASGDAPAGGDESAAVSDAPEMVADGSAEPPAADAEPTEEASESSETSESKDATGEASSGASASDAETPPTSEDVQADASADPEASDSAPAAPEPVRRPKPSGADIDRKVKEWQIGRHRAHQIVGWLCDPFGDGESTAAASGAPPAVLKTMPSLKGLSEGDAVVGVVVGIMPFGVFVELAPDCSGLIHISKLRGTFVEEMHETVSVGDVVSAYVTGIDEKRRRVALSMLSPSEEAEIEQRRRDDRGPRRGGPRGGNRSNGGAARGANDRGDQRGGNPRGGSGGRGGQNRGGQGGRGGGGGERSRGDGNRGRGRGEGRDGRGGGRPRERSRGGRQPESYRVESQKEVKPLTDAMAQGKEPMRSFGDLAQFVGKGTKPEPAPPTSAAEQPANDAAAQDVPAEKLPVAPEASPPPSVPAEPAVASETAASDDSDATA